jgi:hypothetical protein
MNHTLGDEGEHGLATTGVVRELLAVALVLLDGPNVHLTDSDDKEQVGRPGQGQNGNGQPGQGLEEVVRARNQVETVTAGDLADTGAWGTQVAEGDMGVEVGELGKDVEGNASVDKGVASLGQLCSGGVPGTVDPVGEVETGQQVIMGAVLEDIAEGHGAMREAVDKDGLILALNEVQHHHPVRNTIGRMKAKIKLAVRLMPAFSYNYLLVSVPACLLFSFR